MMFKRLEMVPLVLIPTSAIELAFEAMGHDHILPALAKYYCSADLVFSKKLGGLIFESGVAQRELGHLAGSNKGADG